MIDYNKTVRSALATVLPTYYEMALTADTKTPCISYMELSNYMVTDNNYDNSTIGYSSIIFQVKVWSNKIAEIQQYALEVDKVMRSIGAKRTGSNELYDNNSSMIQKILTYECLALEEY